MSAKASWRLVEGDEIGPGRSVVRALGGGKRYEVFLVWDEGLGGHAVAKVLRPDQVGDEGALRALRREASALSALSHAVIVRGLDAVLEPPHPHVLVERVEGPTLRQLVKEGGPLSAERVLPLAAGVATALEHMAGAGWVHLDVKPSNIVAGDPPRLIDLSLARPLARAVRLRGHVGTNAFMSPEQCVPAGDIGPPADVWGLGATLYYAVSGRRPFTKPVSTADGTDPSVRFPQLVEEVRPFAVPVAPALAAAIYACLRKDPAERPTASELALWLQEAVAEPA